MKRLQGRGRGLAVGGYALCVLTFACERGHERPEVEEKVSPSLPDAPKLKPPVPVPVPAPVQECPASSTARSEIELKEPWSEPGVERGAGQANPPARLRASSTLSRKPTEQTVKLFLPFADDRFMDCLAHGSVELKVPACELPLDFAIKSLLVGLQLKANHPELSDPMQQSTKGESIAPLVSFYQGLQVSREGIVVLQFSEASLAYLNQAACAADAVRSSLSRTAQQFEGISGVAFVIDGKPFNAWDG